MKAVLAGIALCLGSLAANAALVAFNFTATLKSPLDAGAGPWLEDVSAGTTGTGSFVIDTSIPNPNAPSVDSVLYQGGLVSGDFTIGGTRFFTGYGDVLTSFTLYNSAVFGMEGRGGGVTGVGGAEVILWNMTLLTTNTDPFLSGALPDMLDFADFADYAIKEFTLSLRKGGQEGVAYFEVTSIEQFVANAVPEPASFALVGAGLLGIAALRRRRVRRR